ncbi:MAG TPA: hypothetical protein VNT22_05135 [Baekduia sp.]|nr:hypothetical protein [Baekduia sp.]
MRPDEFNVPLLLHILGATALVGALVTSLVLAGAGAPARTTFRTLLWAAVPAWILMYAGGLWIADKEGLNGSNPPDWIDIGNMTAEPASLAIVVATVLAWLAARKGGTASRIVTVLVAVAVLLALVAVWAMTTKPS